MKWAVLALGAVAACGRIGFDPTSDAISAPDSGFTGAMHTSITVPSSEPGDQFGFTVAMSGDGNTLAVTSIHEDSAATGIDGNQADNSALDSGAVFIFVRSGPSWVQQAYVKASNTGADDLFGQMIVLSFDGNTLAVGAHLEDSAATGIGGNQADNSAMDAGAVYVFARTGTTWAQQAYLKASNPGAGDELGIKLAMAADGNTLVAGAVYEASAATGVGGNQGDNSATNAGAAYVFSRTGTTWSQEAYVKATNTGAQDAFGDSLCLSADGTTLAVASFGEDSAAVGIGANQADDSAMDAGAAYIYSRSGTTWTPQAYVKASNTDAGDKFGNRICSLSADGATLTVGSSSEASAATGVGADQASNTAPSSGAVYVFIRSGTTWSQQAYIKAINTDAGDLFGFQSALSAGGNALFVGAPQEDSGASGIDGNAADNSVNRAGAVYLYTRATNGIWAFHNYLKPLTPIVDEQFGFSIAIGSSGRTLAAGAPGANNGGAVEIYDE